MHRKSFEEVSISFPVACNFADDGQGHWQKRSEEGNVELTVCGKKKQNRKERE